MFDWCDGIYTWHKLKVSQANVAARVASISFMLPINAQVPILTRSNSKRLSLLSAPQFRSWRSCSRNIDSPDLLAGEKSEPKGTMSIADTVAPLTNPLVNNLIQSRVNTGDRVAKDGGPD